MVWEEKLAEIKRKKDSAKQRYADEEKRRSVLVPNTSAEPAADAVLFYLFQITYNPVLSSLQLLVSPLLFLSLKSGKERRERN